MEMFKWLPGRQMTCQYLKYCFLFEKIGRFGFDGYILKYKPYAKLPMHVDPADNGRHYRLNIVLKRSWDISIIEKTIFNLWDYRITLFRPDKYRHCMANGSEERIVLSLGMLIKNKT